MNDRGWYVDPGLLPERHPDTFRSARPEGNGADNPALLSMADMLEAGGKEPDWFLDGLLPGGGMSLLCGDPKTGKTTFGRCLAYASVLGLEFLDRLPVKGPAVVASLEDSPRKTAAHFGDLGVQGDEPIFFATRDRLPETNRQREAALRDWIARYRAKLVVIDPLFSFWSFTDENRYVEMSRELDRILAVARDTGAHILLVHHASKAGGEDGKAALGSQALFGKPDCILTLRRQEDGSRYLSTRQREGEDMAPVNIRLEATGWIALGKTRAERAAAEDENAVLAAIGPDWTPKRSIPKAVGMKAQHANRAIAGLIDRGIVEQRGEGRRSSRLECRLRPDAAMALTEAVRP